jgi:hypothetical protein
MKSCCKTICSNARSIHFHRVLALGFFALATTIVAAPLVAQTAAKSGDSSVAPEQFVGTWQAEFAGQPYFIIHVSSITPNIVGTMSLAHEISTGPDGEISAVQGPAKLSDSHPMLEPKLQENRLSFKLTEEDDAAHPDVYEIALTSTAEATLRLTETFDNEEGRNLTAEEISRHLRPAHLRKIALPASTAQQFVGTWRAEMNGRPYFILNIESVTPKIFGKFVAAPGLNVSPNGEVTNIWSDAKLSDAHALIEPKLEDNRLSFQYKFEAGDEYADTFEMVLNTPDEATLRLIKTFDNQERRFISEEEIAKAMKPTHLKKAADPAKK